MYNDRVKVHIMREDAQLSLSVYIDENGLLELSDMIASRFPDACVDGYFWSSFIRCYVGVVDPELMDHVESNPAGGMVTVCLHYSEANMVKLRRFESHVLAMLADEAALMAFIEAHYRDIEWD